MLLSLAASPASPVRVVPCSAWNGGTESRGWTISSPAADGTLAIQFKNQKSDVATPLLCLDAAAGSTAAIPALAPCSAGSATQKWRTNPAGHFFTGGATSDSPGAKCLAVANSNYSVGPSVVLTSCYQHNNDRRQSLTWTVDATHTSIASNGAACCGDIYLKRPACLALDATPTCADLKIVARRTNTDVPWCDATKPAQVRAAALVAAMTLEEKATNMDSHNFGVPRLAVPINVFSEALHGMCSGCGAKVAFPGEYISTGCPTSFPQVISMGASWNRSLWSAVGTAVSNETRGLYSQGSGALSSGWEAALFLWAPNVNPFRDPRWGRGQEVVSEDPLVCGEYAAHYIPALQGILPRPDTIEEGGARVKQLPFLKTVATVKHFFDYDLEGSPGTPTSRQEIDVNVTARDQVEFFSPPFEAAITRGHSQSIMCSYNAVNGIPACLSSAMLNDKLRGDWQVRRLSSSLSLSLSSLLSPLPPLLSPFSLAYTLLFAPPYTCVSSMALSSRTATRSPTEQRTNTSNEISTAASRFKHSKECAAGRISIAAVCMVSKQQRRCSWVSSARVSSTPLYFASTQRRFNSESSIAASHKITRLAHS